MINISNLPKPDVMQVLDYEAILNQNIENFKTLVPDWIPLESDEFKMILEAFAYRELHLRAEFNNLASAFFLSTSTKNDLDNYWNSFEDRTKEKIFDSSYLIGTPNENSECIFNYNLNGAVTSCKL